MLVLAALRARGAEQGEHSSCDVHFQLRCCGIILCFGPFSIPLWRFIMA